MPRAKDLIVDVLVPKLATPLPPAPPPSPPTLVPPVDPHPPPLRPHRPAMNINNIFKRSKSTANKQPSHDPPPPLSASSSNGSSSSSQQVRSEDSTGRRRAGHRDTNDSSRTAQFSGTRSADSSMLRGSSAQPVPALYTNDQDMYTQNDLENFSFGAARASYTSSITSPAVDPLTRYDGDDNSGADTTPRPSVVAGHGGHDGPSRSTSRRPVGTSRDPNNSTVHGAQERPTSQISQQDLTSEDESHGRHETNSSTSGSRSRSRHVEDDQLIYLSDEEIDLYDYDDPDIYAPQPIGIPGSSRDPYARRPSRSMEELRAHNLGPNAGSLVLSSETGTAADRYSPSLGTSYPGTQVDWIEARKRSEQLDKDLPERDKELPVRPGMDLDTTPWMDFGKNGLIDMDLADMSDIMNTGPKKDNAPRAYSIRKTSTASVAGRRQSTVSSNDIFYQTVIRDWTTKDSREMWLFKLTATKDKNKELVKKGQKETWKGLDLGFDETWKIPSIGKLTVGRRNQPSGQADGTIQQRINIHLNATGDRPPVFSSWRLHTTIHRHSRVRAFSLYRTYRFQSDGQDRGVRKISYRTQPMILLAPIDVQKNSTSTNTTRRLESHGLLDDTYHRDSRRDNGRHDRDRGRDRDNRPPANDKGKGKYSGSGRDTKNNYEGSAGSVAKALADGSSEPFVDMRLARRNQGPNEGTSRQHARNGVEEEEEEEEDEDDLDSLDGRRRKHTRTPYSEVYGTLPASAFEAQQQEASRSWLNAWGKPRPVVNAPDYQQPYMPLWPVSRPRSNNQKYVVDDLNTSFTDLGLLPPISEKNSSSSKRRNENRHSPRSKGKGKQLEDTSVFGDIPPNTLFMILPLWPGEAQKSSGQGLEYCQTPPVEERLYLIVLYRLQPTSKTEKKPDKEKKRQHASEEENVHVLITKPLQMSARIIAHADLQGTGIRVPDHGMAVSGDLEEAINTMPREVSGDDYIIIGLFNGRHHGIECLPYGFATLHLAVEVPENQNNNNTAHQNRAAVRDEFHDDDLGYLPTPIGRAVMEMVFAGAIAVTSFNPAM